MATYTELYDLMNESALRNRVAVACLVAAEAVRNEAVGTANHDNRLTWARATFTDPQSAGVRMLPAILAAQKNPELPGDLWAVCETVLRLVSIGVDAVNMDDSASIQMFGALRQYGIISAQQAVAIDALAMAATISRAEQIGLGATVTVDDIERSRIVPALDALRVRLASGYNMAVAALDEARSVPEWHDLIAVIEAA